jgi:hypothetical protein
MHPGSTYVTRQGVRVALVDPDRALAAARAGRVAEPRSPILPDEVGPLLAQAEALRDQQPMDDATRALWLEAVSRALTGDVAGPLR